MKVAPAEPQLMLGCIHTSYGWQVLHLRVPSKFMIHFEICYSQYVSCTMCCPFHPIFCKLSTTLSDVPLDRGVWWTEVEEMIGILDGVRHIVRLRRRTRIWYILGIRFTIILDKLNCLRARWLYNERIFDQTREIDQKGNAILTTPYKSPEQQYGWLVRKTRCCWRPGCLW